MSGFRWRRRRGGVCWWLQLCPPVSAPTRSQQLHTKLTKTSSNTTLASARHCARGTAVWYRCGQCVVSGGTVTDVDCERGCPPPVRWPTLLHPSFRGPTSPISPTTSPRQQISPPSGPPTLSLRPQATLDSFQGFQVHCLVFWSFFPFNRLKCLKITTTLVTISECLVLVLV